MVKKIRFPLEMENGVQVRSMEELRDNFSLARVLEYVKNEKMVIWLRDRYEDDIADAIEQLDKYQEDLAKKVSEIFDVPYDEKSEEDLRKAAERAERVKRLKEFTEEKRFIDNIDKVAFDQDEMYDLLDEDENLIYLCGDRFSIPLSKRGVSYIGINNPVVVINSKVEVDWIKKEISLESVQFDEKYQSVIDSANATKEKLYEQLVKTVKNQSNKTMRIGNYDDKTYLSFMIPQNEKKNIEKTYDMARSRLEELNYDIDKDIVSMKKIAHDNNIIGLASRYIESL